MHLWRGFHTPELAELLKTAWQKQRLIILVPTHLKTFSFMSVFNVDEIDFHGDWPEDLRAEVERAAGFSARGGVGSAAAGAAVAAGASGLGSVADTDQDPLLEKAAMGIFTSGTQSGKSRLILYSRENIESSLASIRELFEVRRIKNIFVYPQPTHTFGLILGYMQAALHDLPLHFAPGFYSKQAHQVWLHHVDEGTLTLGTPTHFMDLLNFVATTGIVPKKSYSAIIGGARVTKKLWCRIRDELHIEAPSVGYGATEASPGVTHLPPGVEPAEDGDIGYALSGVQMQILPDIGMSFQGKNVCLAVYENDRLQSHEKIILRDQLTQHGKRYSFIGRTDLVLNRGGLKISLEDLEGRMTSHFQADCAAVSVFDERLGEDLGLIVDSGSKASAEDVQQFVQEQWNIRIPVANVLFAPVPFTSNRKIDRKESLRVYLRQQKWQYPVTIPYLKSLMPHRGGAIWVDAITSSKHRQGTGEVIVDPTKHYCTDGQIREASHVEFVAQTYGYTVALNDLMGISPMDKTDLAFIVEVKNTEIFVPNFECPAGAKLHIEAACTHDFGPLKLLNGTVSYQDQLLARVSLTVFTE